MKKFLAAVAITGAAAFGLAAPAGAATGNQQFQITGLNNKQTVVASGPISGTGKDIVVNDLVDRFVFAHGSVYVNHPVTSQSGSFDPTTCTNRFSFTGTYTFEKGTGVYKGVTGSGTYRGTGVFIGKKTSKGCSDTQGTNVITIFARGTTTTP
jgi:hypothetical protein